MKQEFSQINLAYLISMRGKFIPQSSNKVFLTWFNYRDNVEWTDEQKLLAEEAVKKNGELKFNDEQLKELEKLQSTNWDSFYGVHQNRFFKDRHWLFTEFPELAPNKSAPERIYPESNDIVNRIEELKIDTQVGEGRKIFEIGSGVGNSKQLFM